MTTDSQITARVLEGRATESRTREALVRITVPVSLIDNALLTGGDTLDFMIAQAAG